MMGRFGQLAAPQWRDLLLVAYEGLLGEMRQADADAASYQAMAE